MTVLVIDNYDSFTYNLVEYISEHTPDTLVRRNTTTIEEITNIDPDAIVISPGPGHPKHDRDIGITRTILTDLTPTTPTLGVCLGLEAAVYVHGGTIGHAPSPIHGKASPITHDGNGVYRNLPQNFRAGRYHSLIATDIPAAFDVTATTDHDDTELIMGVRHTTQPLYCVQFHPESVLTGVGHDIITNFLDLATIPTTVDTPT